MRSDAVKNMQKITAAETAGKSLGCSAFSQVPLAIEKCRKATLLVSSVGWWYYQIGCGSRKRVLLVCSVTTLTATAAALICPWYERRLIIWQGDPRGRMISVVATQYLPGLQTVKPLIQDAIFSRDSANVAKNSLPHSSHGLSPVLGSMTGYFLFNYRFSIYLLMTFFRVFLY